MEEMAEMVNSSSGDLFLSSNFCLMSIEAVLVGHNNAVSIFLVITCTLGIDSLPYRKSKRVSSASLTNGSVPNPEQLRGRQEY
jgi:hypothetical protein